MTEPAGGGVTIHEANARIATLSRLPVPICCEAEDWTQPLDADIQVSGGESYTHIRLMVDGQAVSWCYVADFQQQIGTQCLRMGGIAGVGTHDNYRFRGFSKRVMLNALRWMRQEGYDTSMLYGIAGYYPRFGYAEAFPTIIHTMAVRDAERAVRGCHCLTAFAPEHVPGILALFATNNAGRTGITRRDPRYWTPFRKGLRWDTQARAKVLLDAHGTLVGYFVSDTEQVQEILEVGYATHAVFDDLLRAIADQVWEARIDTVRFNLPEDHAFVHYCRPFGMQTQSIYRRDGGAMIRMINLPTTLGKLSALLAARMSGRGELTIHTNLESVGLHWSHGALHVSEPLESGEWVRLPQWCLAQLIYGYLGAESSVNDNTIIASRNGRTLLAQLFPVQPHYHYAVDHF